jgi:dTDP-4-amino-4,6-dideoxygalactose transaminase
MKSKDTCLRIVDFKDSIRPNYCFMPFIEQEYALSRDQTIKYLFSKKIQSRPIWGLISDQKPYMDCQIYKIDKAIQYLDNVVNIPCSSNLSREDAEYIAQCLKQPVMV